MVPPIASDEPGPVPEPQATGRAVPAEQPDEELLASLELESTPRSVAKARRLATETLAAAGLPESVVETAVLLTSELVTNAVLHATAPIVVRVAASRGVRARVDVYDPNRQRPQRRRHDTEAVSGRGLELVETLASNFGVTPIPGAGKSVWFTVEDSPVSPSSGSWGEQDPAAASAMTAVALLHVPTVLYEVMAEHNEALLREYTLHQLNQEATEPGLLELADAQRAQQLVFASYSTWRTQLGGPPPGDHADLVMQVATADSQAFAGLAAAVTDAEQLARDGKLLTLPALPEIAALRDWLLGQATGQLAGGPATPWSFAEAPFRPPTAAAIDTSWVDDTASAVIVGDAWHRILAVSGFAAEALGWEPSELVGQRLTAVIPPRLREAHVAGFTRHLVTGRRRILDQEIVLPALHRDGSEVTVRVRVERQHQNGATIFLAWIAVDQPEVSDP